MLRLPPGGSSRVAGEGEGVNDRSAQTIRLRMNEQYAPISVCYMPTNRAFVNRPYKQTVGMLTPVRLARTPRLQATVLTPFLI